MGRVIWKGAISFGLVHIPVALRTGVHANDLDFDLLDRRDMARIGYSRINKTTGQKVESAEIVKGYQFQPGEYVLMSDEDFRQANVAATQTVEILAFVDTRDILPLWFETPYYLEPDRRGDKGYALLRAVLRATGKAGLATVVMHSRQHLAALLVLDSALVLNTMRFADEVQPLAELKLPGEDLGALGIAAREIDMATRLVDDMSEPWDPARFHDTYREDLLKRIDARIAAGATHLPAAPVEEAASGGGAQVIDLAALLKKSIEERGRGRPAKTSTAAARAAPAAKAPRKRPAAHDLQQAAEEPARPRGRKRG